VLHDVRDPGNAGTIIRSGRRRRAVTGVVFTGQSVDPLTPRRCAQRRVRYSTYPSCEHVGRDDCRTSLSGGATVFATVVHGGVSHRDVDFSQPCVVVIGNEAEGLDATSREMPGLAKHSMAGRT
jgi:TrmH family RNA methyltransferase